MELTFENLLIIYHQEMKRQRFILVLLVFLFFLTRLLKLMEMPLFIDETVQLTFARAFLENPLSPFVSLNHGEQPIFTWLLALPVLWMPDPLLAGRLVSVCTGFFCLTGLWAVARFYSLSIGKWFVVFSFTFSPLFLLHDRLALKDSLLAASSIWLFYFLVRWFRTLSWKWSTLAAVMLGAALLIKNIALLFIPLVPLTLVAVSLKDISWRRLFNQAALFALIAFAMRSILFLSSGYGNMASRDTSFLLPWVDFFRNPFHLIPVNGMEIINWLSIYLGWPTLFMVLFSPPLLWRQRKGILFALLVWIFFPLGVYLLVGRVIFPRYLIFTLLFWHLLMAFCLEEVYVRLKGKWSPAARLAAGGMIVFLLWSPVSLCRQILFNLREARFAAVDRWQFLEGWPAGYGFNEAVRFFQKQPAPCLVLTEEHNYLTALGLPLYLRKDGCQIKRVDLWGEEVDFEEFRSKYSGKNLFVVLNKRQTIPHGGWLKEVASYPKVGNKESLKIYRFNENR